MKGACWSGSNKIWNRFEPSLKARPIFPKFSSTAGSFHPKAQAGAEALRWTSGKGNSKLFVFIDSQAARGVSPEIIDAYVAYANQLRGILDVEVIMPKSWTTRFPQVCASD